MFKKVTTILLILASCSLFSCSNKIAKIFPNRPNTEMEFAGEPSNEFKQGWEDGCEVGMSGGSNTFYKAFYQNNKVDGYKMATSKDYKTSWSAGFWYCYRHDHIKQKSSIWGSVLTGYK